MASLAATTKFGYVRDLPEDDLMHAVGPQPDFNESAYYTFGDLTQNLSGWMRVGNRVNEGRAEVMLCFYLPDGSVAFWFQRAPIDNNDAHCSGGLRLEVITPHVEHRVSFDGTVLRMKDASDIRNPGRAYKENPRLPCRAELTFRGVSDTYWPWAAVDEQGAPVGEDFQELFNISYGHAHLEQDMAVEGTISVGDEQFTVVRGAGVRDRSWGARDWQGLPWYRWTTCSFGTDFGLVAMLIGDESGERHPRGWVHHGRSRQPERVAAIDIAYTYDDEWNPLTIRLIVDTDEGRQYIVNGEVWSDIPLFIPHHTGGGLTSITEGNARWTCDGRSGVGMVECFDQVPAGLSLGEVKTGRP